MFTIISNNYHNGQTFKIFSVTFKKKSYYDNDYFKYIKKTIQFPYLKLKIIFFFVFIKLLRKHDLNI